MRREDWIRKQAEDIVVSVHEMNNRGLDHHGFSLEMYVAKWNRQTRKTSVHEVGMSCTCKIVSRILIIGRVAAS